MKAYVESLGIIAPKAVYRNLTPAQWLGVKVPFPALALWL